MFWSNRSRRTTTPSSHLELARHVLEQEGRALSAREIWSIAREKGWDQQLIASENPVAVIETQLSSYARREQEPGIYCLEGDTARFVHAKWSMAEAGEREYDTEDEEMDEIRVREYHRLLTYFAFHFMDGCYTRTVNVEGARRSNGAVHLAPDMIGCVYLSKNLKSTEVDYLAENNNAQRVKLFAFGVKGGYTYFNEREFRDLYLDTVNTTNWAHEGYLAMSFGQNVLQSNDFREAAGRLNANYGIGIVHLNPCSPIDSRMLFPARTRAMDYVSLSKIASEHSPTSNTIRYINDTLEGRRGPKCLTPKKTEARLKWDDEQYPDRFDHQFELEDLIEFYKEDC